MMHYRKGENIEQKLTKEELPFEDFVPKGKDFLWMHVNGGTKVTNVITYAKNSLEKGEHGVIVWSGSGGGVVKTISCAEIIKRSFPLYQVTRMRYVTVEEHWKPQTEGLDEIVAKRQVPSIHIYMSLDAIDDSVSGLQKPNSKSDFWSYNDNANHNSRSSHGSSLSNNNYNRNQRHRRLPKQQKEQRPLNTAAGENQPLTPQQAGTEETSHTSPPSSSQQQHKSKRRRPQHNTNRGPPKTQATTDNQNENGNSMQPMDS